MRNILVLLALVLVGCDGADFDISCKLRGFSLTCNANPQDAAVVPPVPVVDAGTPVVDSGIAPDAGQSVDSSVASVDTSVPAVVPPVVTPPVTPTGVFKVVGSKLYDPKGNEFRIRGNNRTHIDNPHAVANLFKANTNRWLAYFISDPDRTIRDITRASNGGTTANGFVAIPGDWAQTCADNDGTFEQIIQRWVAGAAKYQAVANVSIMNIANEYSPSSDEKWRDKYSDAIKRIRAAGYHGNIQVDARGCGQEASSVIRYGQAVLAADPEHNVHFSVHIYGAFYSEKYGQPKEWRSQDLVATFDALKATGLHIVLGEVGPGPLLGGGNGGPSPTKIPASAVVAEAEARGFGWLLWSSDDNTEANAMCNNDSFCMTYDTNKFELGANLTDWGKEATALWTRYATKASIFN